ncbi:MAG: 3-hydroxy-5-phosphonooxypentane-2,4-dione thiolase [Thaumarchaeota archaeon]|nr:3-hydroxy-5-phosphonooxypentane-2,4-dione thiolase [Nitrososphaerota archaeon]
MPVSLRLFLICRGWPCALAWEGRVTSWGEQNRISRMMKDGRTVMLAVDHGYFQGPTTGLENPRKTITPLLPYADSLALTRGVLRTSVDPSQKIPIILRVSGGTSILKELSDEVVTTSIEEALRLNASAVALSVFVGSEHEKQTLANLAELVNEGERYGMPVMAITAVGREMARDARYLGLACRIAAELGASIVKTYYCEDFQKVVEGCPVPVVIAGGKKLPEREALQLAFDAVSEGAVGVDMGRNIFQSSNPVGMIRAIRAVVHDGKGVDEAMRLFGEKQPAKQIAR